MVYFNKFKQINDSYLPDTGEGDTMATQICTAVNKLIYGWYNDGDVYDNTYMIDGWCNDLSSYANWLYGHVSASKSILLRIKDVYNGDDYENLLNQLCNALLNNKVMKIYDSNLKQGSIYSCDGPFKFEDDFEDD